MKRYIAIEKKDKYVLSDIEYFADPLIRKQIIDKNDKLEISLDNINEDDIKEVTVGISELVVQIIRNKMLKKYIEKVYKDEDKRDIDDLYKKANEVCISQKNIIIDEIRIKIEEYIRDNEVIDIDGFIKFRIKNLEKIMAMMLEIAVEKYIIEREQEELTSLLRYLINIQEEKIDLLRININKNGSFTFYNKSNEVIKRIEMNDIEEFIINKKMDYEDIFISNLLSYCPDRIEVEDELNNDESRQVVETIKIVFGGKVTHVSTK